VRRSQHNPGQERADRAQVMIMQSRPKVSNATRRAGRQRTTRPPQSRTVSENHPARRQVIVYLLLPIYTWRLNPGPLLVYQAHGQQVSPGLVDELERLISVRRHMDDEHGGGALVNMLHSDLRFVTEMLKHSRYKEPIGRRLYAAAAELARLAGWAAFDSGRHAAAQQYYFAGIRAASALGDHALAVNIIGFLGIQAYSTGRLADAVQLMDVAAAESRKTPAIVQAMTWARTGRAYAKVGDKSTARAALNKSSEFLGKTVSGDTPPWAYWVDETRLTAQSKHSGRRGWLTLIFHRG